MANAPREVWGDLAATAFVESSLLFKSLDADARRDLLQIARVVDYAPGEVVSDVGDDGFLLVRDGVGRLLARRTASDPQVEVADVERGAFFGVSRVLGAPRPWALTARTALSVVAFPAPVIAALAERNPRMRKLLEAVFAARDKEAAQRFG